MNAAKAERLQNGKFQEADIVQFENLANLATRFQKDLANTNANPGNTMTDYRELRTAFQNASRNFQALPVNDATNLAVTRTQQTFSSFPKLYGEQTAPSAGLKPPSGPPPGGRVSTNPAAVPPAPANPITPASPKPAAPAPSSPAPQTSVVVPASPLSAPASPPTSGPATNPKPVTIPAPSAPVDSAPQTGGPGMPIAPGIPAPGQPRAVEPAPREWRGDDLLKVARDLDESAHRLHDYAKDNLKDRGGDERKKGVEKFDDFKDAASHFRAQVERDHMNRHATRDDYQRLVEAFERSTKRLDRFNTRTRDEFDRVQRMMDVLDRMYR